ncbi:uncharacterized protein TNCV_216381 [Trichonephila clavipes]|nr:uncharacterized protein TNCV_216381 [Trichonephila clavipes]
MQNFTVDYDLRETPARVETRRNRFPQHRQFRQVSCNCFAKERCLPSNKVNGGTNTPIGNVYERNNRWNAGILTITIRSFSNSECGTVCDLKTVADVSKNGRCYPTTSIRSTKSQNPSPRPIFGNKCAASEYWVRHSHSPQECKFRDKLLTGNSIMLACMPEDQQFAFPSRLRINALV